MASASSAALWKASRSSPDWDKRMTDEQKALKLVNEMAAAYAKRAFTTTEPHLSGHRVIIGFDNMSVASDFFYSLPDLLDFISKPNPLAEVFNKVDADKWTTREDYVDRFRAALEARGLEIREKGQ